VRLVEVIVPTGKREAVLSVLDDEGIDYVVTEETSGREYTAVVSFPVPKVAVEPVLDDLRAAGLGDDAFTVVLTPETVVSRRFEQLQERYDDANDNGDRIAREELVARAEDLAPNRAVYLVMTVVSAVVATAGLLLDSPAVVVGSMVIAPLIGPAMATSVGSVLGERELFTRGIKLQAAGGLLAVVAAGVFALLLRTTGVVPLGPGEVLSIGEVEERLDPGVLSLAVALAAGVAGAFSLSSGVSAALVGVMIAAALVPPTAVVGIGIAWGEPATVVGSGVLVLVNFLSVNLAALVVLYLQGYRPENWFREDEARTATLRRIGTLVVAVAALSLFLGGVSYAAVQTAAFEEDARATVEGELADFPDELTLVSMDVTYGGELVRRPAGVIVTVGYPAGTDPPSLRGELADAVHGLPADRFGVVDPPAVRVEVRYVAVERPPDSVPDVVGGRTTSPPGATGSPTVDSVTRAGTVGPVCQTALCA
jgi:uncharacterized hydrophobic protein (TIGR00341 family)